MIMESKTKIPIRKY